MLSWLPSIGFLAALITLIYSCVVLKAPLIEAELTRAAAEALRAQSLETALELVMDGRDAWLSGNAPNEETKAAAERSVAAVRGVRAVHNLLHAGDEPPAVAPAAPELATALEPPGPNPPATPKQEAPPSQPKPAVPAQASPAPAPAGPAGSLQRSIDALVAGRSVEFQPGRDRLTDSGAALVDELAALLTQHPDARIEVAGHTDSQGTSRNNLAISLRRAEAVRRRLIEKGMNETRLTAKGYGEDKPIADNSTSQGRLRNRRVELTVQ